MKRLTHDERLASLRAAIKGAIRLPYPLPRGNELRAALIAVGCITPAAHCASRDWGVLEMDEVGYIEAAQTIFLHEDKEIASDVVNRPESDERVASELRVMLAMTDLEVKTLSSNHRARDRAWRELFPPDDAEKGWVEE
jgi:hypothetical protein